MLAEAGVRARSALGRAKEMLWELNAAPEVVLRLVVGNVILAIVAAVPSYFIAYQVVDRYRRNETGLREAVAARLGWNAD